MNRQERRYHAQELMIIAQELVYLLAELQADCAREQQSILLDQAANLVLNIPANGHEMKSRNEYRTNLLACLS